MVAAVGTGLEQYLWRYAEPFTHQAVSALIRQHSTNSADIREVALSRRSLGSMRQVLELGCGFGFMSGFLAERIHPAGRITGVDACRDNGSLFEHSVRAAGRRAVFILMTVEDSLPWNDDLYDLVVASHSLYYFADAIPDIARVLKPEGAFLTVTHSLENCRGLCRLAGVLPETSRLHAAVSHFSTENGEEKLRGSFASVERVDYKNSLRFTADEASELVAYLRFKFRFMNDWPESEPDLRETAEQELRDRLAHEGEILVEKNDAAFWCEQPLPRPAPPDLVA